MSQQFTIFTANGETTVLVKLVDDHLFFSNEELERSFGWQLKPEGLCQREICIPIRNRDEIVTENGLNLRQICRLWQRPLAANPTRGMGFLGESAGSRADALRGGQAPEFSLPDLSGVQHRLSDYRGKKIFLIAYASW